MRAQIGCVAPSYLCCEKIFKITFMAEVDIHSAEKIKNKEAAQNAKPKILH